MTPNPASTPEPAASKPAAFTPLGPLNNPPTRIRPPFDVTDRARIEQRAGETPDQWRARGRANRVAALLEPMDGVELGAYDRRIVDWLAGWDIETVGTVASLIYRARSAGPVGGAR